MLQRTQEALKRALSSSGIQRTHGKLEQPVIEAFVQDANEGPAREEAQVQYCRTGMRASAEPRNEGRGIVS